MNFTSGVFSSKTLLSGFEIVRRDKQINYISKRWRGLRRNESAQLSTISCQYTWYKPPTSPPDLFHDFENLIGKIDGSNREL